MLSFKKMSGFILLISTMSLSYSQPSTEIQRFPLQKTVNVKQITYDYYFSIQLVEMPVPGGISNVEKAWVRSQIPEKIRSSEPTSSSMRSAVDKPILFTNYEGNLFNGRVPNDNHLAISNNGDIVSVINSVINFYNEAQQTHNPVSLDTFGAIIGLPHHKYDPKIIYDPQEDKFIMVFLNGSTDINSHIFVAFSKTNDPTDDWNVYTLPGNPLADSSWSDFPMIALSEDELFLTINLLRNMQAGESWKNTFKQTLIWQIDKSSGYQGDSLVSRYYDNIEHEGKSLRNLCPVKGGSKLYGPEMYFLSNRNFTLSSDSFFIAKINGKLDDPNTTLTIRYIKSDKPYGAPPYADQPVNRLLETNDARVLDAYIENGTIHFAGNSVNFENNLASFYHGTITSPETANSVKLTMMHHPYLEFGYPSIAYTGEGTADEAIILVNHSSDSIHPGVSAFFYKDNNWSEPLRIKEGETPVTVQWGKEQRWGDYTGLQRKYNEKGLVWGAGYYGKFISSSQRYNATWICQLKSPSYSSITEADYSERKHLLYPAPAYEWVRLEFMNSMRQECDFMLYDSQGKMVKFLQRNLVREGVYSTTFNVSHLSKGTYFLIVKGDRGLDLSFRVLVQ